MTVDRAHMLVLTELVLLLLMETNVLTKLIQVSRLAFRGNVSTPVIGAVPGAATTGNGVPVTVTGTGISFVPHGATS